MSCVFCDIASGAASANVRAQDDEFVAFDDLYPKADTHVLVIPREHHDDLDAWVAAGGSSDRMLAFAARTADELGVAGRYRLITNVGSEAGQMIPHVHFHILAGSGLPGF